MSHGDAAKNEEGGEARQRQQPVEDVAATLLVQVDECQAAEEKLEQSHNQGTAFAINVREEFGSHA